MKIEEIKLSENVTIYRYQYNWNIPKKKFIDKVYTNYKIEGVEQFGNTTNIVLKCNEFNEIHKLAYEISKSLTTIIDDDYIDTNFIYMQDANTQYSTKKMFHTHEYTFSHKIKLNNDWTYCFYLQMPKNVKGNEGKLSFKDLDGSILTVSPNEGDILVFNANLLHTPESTPNAECDRLTIVGTFAFNVTTKFNSKNSII